MFVKEFFVLEQTERLTRMKPRFGYNGFGEAVFWRTYSRIKHNGSNESWADVVIRVINGCMSIRKDWYLRNYIHWDETFWQNYATRMAISMFKMEWLPPGRGLWAMGSMFVYERGSMALNNCSFTKLESSQLGEDLDWLMDCLMLGVGVGFEPVRDNLVIFEPNGVYDCVINDDRESWCQSVKLLVNAYTKPNHRLPIFNYSKIRGPGLPIRGFGGVSSGPAPLIKLHECINELFKMRVPHDVVRLKTDLANLIGRCVVAGNVRRSAELCKGEITDDVFLDLKDYDRHPERESFGYLSNNSCALTCSSDFLLLNKVADRVTTRGEPGIMNLLNFSEGRIGKKNKGIRYDWADGLNPCGEITLENKELCNIVETLPTMCKTPEIWFKACEYATAYSSSVSLLPTHRANTNMVVNRNRRIGVSIVDWTGWVEEAKLHNVINFMRRGYKIVRQVNAEMNTEAGVPVSIKVTCIKPGGTVPKLPGKTPGIGYPTFAHTLRRMRVPANHPIVPFLNAGRVPSEPDYFDPNTLVYEFPILQGPSKPATEISLWEQATNLAIMQSEWADNAVSNTLYFDPAWKLKVHEYSKQAFEGAIAKFNLTFDYLTVHKELIQDKWKLELVGDTGGAITEYKLSEFNPHHEEGDIVKVLAAYAPRIKSCSLLPHSAMGVYRQTPEEGITEEEYNRRLAQLKPIDWNSYRGSDGEDEKYCAGGVCEIPVANSIANQS